MDWFKISPASELADLGNLPGGSMKAAFLLLLFYCLKNGSLPDNDQKIADISDLPLDQVQMLRPYLIKMAISDGDQLIILAAERLIREREDYSKKKAAAGKKGGEKTQAVLKQCSSSAQAVLDTAKHSFSHTNMRERENMQTGNPLSHPLGAALLEGAGFNELQRDSLSPMNYSKLGAAVTRLSNAGVTAAQIQAARQSWWGTKPPSFDQLADEALKIASGKSIAAINPKTQYADGREKPEGIKGFVC